MSNYILDFSEITKNDIDIAGGKGANLGEMTGAGIPVPPGFVVTAGAYDRFLEENNIEPDKYERADSLRTAIRNGKIPDEIAAEICARCSSMGERVAVRSSATAEDLDDASFAGQQETYLNVRGEEAILRRVRDCYASLWGDRAISYRKNAGYDRQKVRLAVVVQEMVESESSGVMFTSDPAGDPQNIHINASYGLGEAVVSGIVSPDEYIVDREGQIICTHIGSKEVQIVYVSAASEKNTGEMVTPDGEKEAQLSAEGRAEPKETIQIPVPEEMKKRRVLGDALVRKLSEEGLRIEAHYGHPMDIEWAIRNAEIFILQARSITTLNRGAQAFTEKDFEGLPKVKPAQGAMREMVLFNLEKNPTPYYPLDHDFGGLVGGQKEILFEKVGLRITDGMYPIDDDGISRQSSNKMRPTRKIVALPGYFRQMKDIDGNILHADESLKECRRLFEEEQKVNADTVPEIGRSLGRMRELISKTAFDRFQYALFPNALESMGVTKVLRRLDKDLNSYDVLEGLDYVTAVINREMADMARLIEETPGAADFAARNGYYEICREYPGIGEKLEKFMKRFGAKSDFNCYCFIAKSWREDPDRLINTLRPMITGGWKQVPTREESTEKFKSLMKRVSENTSRAGYEKFKRKVKALRHYHVVREDSQYLWESEFAYCRKLLRRLSEQIAVPYEDLLLFFFKELAEVTENGMTPEYRALLEKRRSKRPLAEAYWNKCMEDALRTADGTITGICGCAGQCKGKVTIVKGPSEFKKLQKGDILVCTYTDPEWTPLFCLAAGVVVDTGGSLSHAAIVAREYNIPAVLATGDATKKLKDGDMVLVDGGNGTVTKL